VSREIFAKLEITEKGDLRKSCGSNHPPKADGSRGWHPLFRHFAAGVARSPASLGRRAGPHREGEGVTAITGRVQRTGGQGIEVGAYFFAVPR
jgi:hypothetical protein